MRAPNCRAAASRLQSEHLQGEETLMKPNPALAAVAAGIAACALWAGSSVGKTPMPADYESNIRRVDVKPGELRWQDVLWRSGFFDGLVEAQAQDKPIFYWIYEGDPRSAC